MAHVYYHGVNSRPPGGASGCAAIILGCIVLLIIGSIYSVDKPPEEEIDVSDAPRAIIIDEKTGQELHYRGASDRPKE